MSKNILLTVLISFSKVNTLVAAKSRIQFKPAEIKYRKVLSPRQRGNRQNEEEACRNNRAACKAGTGVESGRPQKEREFRETVAFIDSR